MYTSESVVLRCFDTKGASSIRGSLAVVKSSKQSHCSSSSVTFVAERMITFWHLICKEKLLHAQTIKMLLQTTPTILCTKNKYHNVLHKSIRSSQIECEMSFILTNISCGNKRWIWQGHIYGRDMDFRRKKWSIRYNTVWYVAYLEVSKYYIL